MNEKLKNVKLGAPESIAVNNCGTLENLDVQITERLESISFRGNTGTKNPFERAADLLRLQEVELGEAEGIRPEIEGLPKEYLPCEYIQTSVNVNLDTEFVLTKHTVEILLDQPLNYYHITGGGIAIRQGGSAPNSEITVGSTKYGFQGYVNTPLVINPNITIGGNEIATFDAYTDIPSVTLFYNIGNVIKKIWYYRAKNIETNSYDVNMIAVIKRDKSSCGFYDTARQRYFTHSSFTAGPIIYDDSISLDIPTDAILNGGDTTCEIKSDDTTLPAKDYYWQLTNINPDSTAIPTIDQRGNISIEDGKWAEFDVKVKRYADASWLKKDLKIGIFYSIKSSELRNEIVNNRTLADKIASDYIFAKNADDFCSNYTQVEWLRSNASKQYIASGIVLNDRSKFEFIAEWDSSISRTWFMGAMYKKMFVGSENATTLVAAFRSDNGDVFSWPFNFNIGTEYLFKLENGKTSVNDTVFEFTKQSFGDTYEAYLFATNAGSGPYAYNTVTARIKMAKIIGYRHYLPALDKEGRPCMYDMISGQAFYNQGTGEFTYGPIKRNFELFI